MVGTKQTGPTTPEIVRWISGDLQKLTVDTAEEVLKREVGAGRFTTRPVVVTDGDRGKDYRSVKPGGKIEFVATPELRDAVRWALEQLVLLSPVRSGRYRDSHLVLVNGQGKTGTAVDAALLAAKPGDRVQIVNTQPYARKIEGQRANRRKQFRGRRGLSRQAPSGVYRKVHQMLVQRFARTLFVDYRVQVLEIGGEIAKTSGERRGASGYYTYPVLQFYWKP